MPKATIADLQAMGFEAQQFGTPEDWAETGGYLDKILARYAVEVEARVGKSTYDAAGTSGATFEYLRDAERFFSAAELWRRRAQRLDADMQTAHAETAALLQREYLRTSESYDARALAALAAVGGASPESRLAAGYVETENFGPAA